MFFSRNFTLTYYTSRQLHWRTKSCSLGWKKWQIIYSTVQKQVKELWSVCRWASSLNVIGAPDLPPFWFIFMGEHRDGRTYLYIPILMFTVLDRGAPSYSQCDDHFLTSFLSCVVVGYMLWAQCALPVSFTILQICFKISDKLPCENGPLQAHSDTTAEWLGPSGHATNVLLGFPCYVMCHAGGMRIYS